MKSAREVTFLNQSFRYRFEENDPSGKILVLIVNYPLLKLVIIPPNPFRCKMALHVNK